jgi:phospholipid/cholesterol/gamma-HCH transport system ATP-binding protein
MPAYANPIEITNLEVAYGTKKILHKIDVTIPSSSVTVILGGSGCGKSTLLKSAIGLLAPTAGRVLLLGQDIYRLEEAEFDQLCTRVGMLFQNGALLTSLTVGENVALPLREHTNLPEPVIQNMVKSKLTLVELSHAINLFPSELSGGMRKRAALARAIALDPKILFCDEPSAGLDPLTSAELDNLIIKLKNIFNMTVVVVTHELESIKKIADYALMLDQGRVLFFGRLPDLIAFDHPFVQNFFQRHVKLKEGQSSAYELVFAPESPAGSSENSPLGDGTWKGK